MPSEVHTFSLPLQVHDQASERWIDQQNYQEHAAVGLSCSTRSPHPLLGGQGRAGHHSPDWCRCTECVFVFLLFFLAVFFFMLKWAQAPPSFFYCKMLLPFSTSFSVPKRCRRCDVFTQRPFHTMAAHGNISDPLVFLNTCLVCVFFSSLNKGWECFDLKKFQRDI